MATFVGRMRTMDQPDVRCLVARTTAYLRLTNYRWFGGDAPSYRKSKVLHPPALRYRVPTRNSSPYRSIYNAWSDSLVSVSCPASPLPQSRTGAQKPWSANGAPFRNIKFDHERCNLGRVTVDLATTAGTATAAGGTTTVVSLSEASLTQTDKEVEIEAGSNSIEERDRPGKMEIEKEEEFQIADSDSTRPFESSRLSRKPITSCPGCPKKVDAAALPTDRQREALSSKEKGKTKFHSSAGTTDVIFDNIFPGSLEGC